MDIDDRFVRELRLVRLNMDSKKKKLLAPIIVTLIMVLYYVAYFGLLIWALEGVWKYVLGIIPVALSVVMIAVCVERIKEIQKGEEDDLSKY